MCATLFPQKTLVHIDFGIHYILASHTSIWWMFALFDSSKFAPSFQCTFLISCLLSSSLPLSRHLWENFLWPCIIFGQLNIILFCFVLNSNSKNKSKQKEFHMTSFHWLKFSRWMTMMLRTNHIKRQKEKNIKKTKKTAWHSIVYNYKWGPITSMKCAWIQLINFLCVI